jgi:hypothetical protein
MTITFVSSLLSYRVSRRLFAGVVLLLCASASSFAQNGRLRGNVTDAQKRGIPAASVSATNEQTGIVRAVQSSSIGGYEIPALEPGLYDLRVMKNGFETLSRKGITVTTQSTATADVELTVGQVAQTVAVTADAPLLQQDSPDISYSITTKQFNDIPIVQLTRMRSPASFVYLAPTVQGNYNAAGAENTSATNAVSINGGYTLQNEFIIEGLQGGQMRPVAETSYNESAPAVDAIREFKIQTTLLPADNGHTGPAAGFFVLRTGANQFHMGLHEYFRNNYLDATPWGSTSKLKTRQNEYGGTASGPILIPKIYDGRNKAFFFISYEGSRKKGVDTLSFLKLPTPAEIAGNFTGFPTIYDPATTTLNAVTGQYTRTPFPNNQIPANRIDPVAKLIASYFPAPNNTGANNYAAYSGEEVVNEYIYSTKIDYQLNPSQHLGVAYVHTSIPRFNIGTGLPAPLTSGTGAYLKTHTVRINHNWIFGSNKLNTLAIGFNGFYNPIVAVTPVASIVQQAAIPNLVSTILPAFTFTNGYAPTTSNSAKTADESLYQIKDTFGIDEHGHSVRFGAEYRSDHLNDVSPNPTASAAAFSSLETGNPTSQSGTGDAFASFLLGQVDSGSLTKPLIQNQRRAYFGLFGQDDWHVTPKLTLNLGLRWEFETPAKDVGNKSSIVSLTTPNASAGNLPGALVFAGNGSGLYGSDVFVSNDFSSVGPRIGFAYAALPTTVVRGGYGVYYTDNYLITNTSGYQAAANYSSPNTGITPAFVLSSGFPQSASLSPTLSANLLNGQNASYLPGNAASLPRIQQWSLGIQQSLGKNQSLEVTYVGSHGTRLIDPQMSNPNQVDPKYLSLGSLLTQSATSAAAVSAGITLPYPGFTGTVAQALRPYPQYKTLTPISGKGGANNYNALEVIFHKRLSQGLKADVSYVYSKNLGYSSPTYFAGATDNVLQNASNPRAEYSLLQNDVPHALVIDYVYDFPFGRDQRFLRSNRIEDLVMGGFSLSGIQRYQSGFPLAILETNTLPLFNRVLRPNILPGVDPSTRKSIGNFVFGADRLINPAAFAVPAAFTFGNAAPLYSSVRDFPIYDEDLSVIKRTRITDGLVFTLSAQTFNVLNRHRFTTVDTNFSDYNGSTASTIAASTFGKPSAVSRPRYLQLAARLEF